MSKSRLCLLPLVAAFGCGGSQESVGRIALTGKVTKGGAPVAAASLSFIPENPKSPGVMAVVADGKYSLTKENGPVPGKYRVEATISSESKLTTETVTGAGGRRMGKMVAPAGTKPGEEIDKPATAEITVPGGVSSADVDIDLK